MVLYERSLHRARLGYANDLPRVAAMIAAGLLDPSGMITRRIAARRDRRPSSPASPSDPGDDVKVLVEVDGVSDAATTIVVPMPHMGVSVEEGTVVEWLKQVGRRGRRPRS